MLKRCLALGFAIALIPLTACSQADTGRTHTPEPLAIGAIPDQDPQKLQRQYEQLADYLEAELGVPVEYHPVTDYAAAVTAFKIGDLDLVWFGGLTGVQARLQVPGAEAIAQRDVDAEFRSLFIANREAGLKPFKSLADLTALKGRTFTFGSESSTSGRLMPQYFLQQAGVSLDDFQGEPGFSGDHDKTIALVEAGSYQVGVVNAKVWEQRLEAGEVDPERVQVIWETPPYYDYHWVIHPQVTERYGEDFADKVQAALLALDPSDPNERALLELFSAGKFITTENENYAQIEAIGREIGKIQ